MSTGKSVSIPLIVSWPPEKTEEGVYSPPTSDLEFCRTPLRSHGHETGSPLLESLFPVLCLIIKPSSAPHYIFLFSSSPTCMHKECDSYLLSSLPAFTSGRIIEEAPFSSSSSRNWLPQIAAIDGEDKGGRNGCCMDDMDQRVSEQVLASESSNLTTFSGHDCFDDSPPPLTISHSQSDLSISPAAMFLSAFSPTLVTSAPLPDEEGQVVASHILGPVVGHGAFSTIRTATSPSGGIVAVKIVRHSDVTGHAQPDVTQKQLDNEAEVWASLHHEHILPLFISEHTLYADYFITQYCPAGSLYDILKRDGRPALGQDDVGTMFRQVVRGLQYMHEVAGFVHGDIKLENVLVDETGVCKVSDFGMTKKIGEVDDNEEVEDKYLPEPRKQGLHTHLSLIRHNKPDRSSNGPRHRNSTPAHNAVSPVPAHVRQGGSLPYASPELLLPPHGSLYRPHPAQDIWALGVLLYTLLTGRFPFVDSFEPRLQMKILHGEFVIPKGIGRGAERVLRGCINSSVANRWTIAMVDEVAWGIGWGDEGDSATPSEPEDETPCSRRSVSVVASRSRSPRGDHRYSPFQKSFASRHTGLRSSSPASSRSSSVSTSRDHLRYMPPSLSALTSSILDSTSSSRLRSSRSSSIETDRERGRQLTKSTLQSTSRSPSPSVAPMTPPDPHRSHFFPMQSRTKYDELSTESGEYRGRDRFCSPHFRSARPGTELSGIEENSRWHLTPSMAEYAWEAESSSQDVVIIGKVKTSRAESVPPHYTTIHKSRETNWSHFVPMRMGARSKSVGFESESRYREAVPI